MYIWYMNKLMEIGDPGEILDFVLWPVEMEQEGEGETVIIHLPLMEDLIVLEIYFHASLVICVTAEEVSFFIVL